MKVFRVERENKEPLHFYRISLLRSYLRGGGEVKSIWREWWYGNDLVEEEEYSIEKILTSKASKLKKGQTAQWGQRHGNV